MCEDCTYRNECHNFDLFLVGCEDFDRDDNFEFEEESLTYIEGKYGKI